jgi:ATP synthase protein I
MRSAFSIFECNQLLTHAVYYEYTQKMKQRLTAFSLLGSGFYVAGCTILGVFGGRWLDEKLGTAPGLLLLGLFLGLAVGFYGLYRTIKPLIDSSKTENKTDNAKKDNR